MTQNQDYVKAGKVSEITLGHMKHVEITGKELNYWRAQNDRNRVGYNTTKYKYAVFVLKEKLDMEHTWFLYNRLYIYQ